MKDPIRLIISNKRIEDIQANILKLSQKESHYLNKVMRTKTGDEISIVNGKGYLWKATKLENNYIKIAQLDSPILFQENKKLLIGIAIAIPKNGFEDILKMCTEIGIDFIQPLNSDYQVKKISNQLSKMKRWNSIINESVEQCERLWKPKLLPCIDIYEWIGSAKEKDIISISVTRSKDCMILKEWLEKLTFSESSILWNVIGPEGGWSKNELCFFEKNRIQFIELTESIMRTSTAAINATSILNQWRNFDMKLPN